MHSFTGTLRNPGRVGRYATVAMPGKTLRNLGALLACWHARAVQRRQLLALDDRLLADVGISRAEAIELGQRPFWRE